jgi:putative hydrolase of the HAD superfamily
VLDGRPVTHVLLDFFGTLTDYSPSRTEQGYHRSHELAAAMGATAGYRDFLTAWEEESACLDARSAADHREYAMTEIAERCLTRLLRRQPAGAEVTAFARSYLAEWNTGVSYPPGMAATVAALAARYRLAVVSNTHDPDLVPAHLAAMGVDRYFETVVTSIECGWRKPHPAIYAEALRRLGAEAEGAVFAGDTYDADYAGPVRAGLAAFLIDPDTCHDVPAVRRLSSLADLPARLGCG